MFHSGLKMFSNYLTYFSNNIVVILFTGCPHYSKCLEETGDHIEVDEVSLYVNSLFAYVAPPTVCLAKFHKILLFFKALLSD